MAIDFKELIHYRELLYFLVWRDVKVRYKQTVLGAGWAIIQPLTTMLISTIIFGHVANMASQMPSELTTRHVPYSLFVYSGLLVWMFVSTGVSNGGMSLMSPQNIVNKIYFPRLFVPSAVIGSAMVDTGISFGVFFFLMAVFHVPDLDGDFHSAAYAAGHLNGAGNGLFSVLPSRSHIAISGSSCPSCPGLDVHQPRMFPLDSPIPWKHWALAQSDVRRRPGLSLGSAWANWDLPGLGIASWRSRR